MKKSEVVLFILLFTVTALCINTMSAEVKKSDPPKLPVAGMCNTATGHVQEMRFCKGWEKALQSSKEIRPNQQGEPYLLVSATVTWDEDGEKLAVMYEAYYMMPSLSGLAMCVYSSLEILEPTEFKESQSTKVARMVEVYYIWAQLAAPIFQDLLDHDGCYKRGIYTARG
jgi:hypothetical protein